MTEKITTVVKKKATKEGTGPTGVNWKRCAYTFENDMIMSTFDTSFMNFKEGDKVEVEYEVEGNYKNISTMKLAETSSSDGKIKKELELPVGNKKVKFLITLELLE